MPLILSALRHSLLSGWLATVLVLVLALPTSTQPAYAQPGFVSAERYASIVIDAATGQVLSAVDADAPRRPASLTKIMTAYLVFEAVSARRATWDTPVIWSANAVRVIPSKLGLPLGSRLTLEQALLAIITKSANDSAVAIAEALGGSEDNFARLMTLKARALGMRSTVFHNASGLPDPDQVTTARDMATLGRRIIADFPTEYRFFATENVRLRGRVHWNHNSRFLTGYDGADGIKTGYIKDSGYNLVASSVRNGRRLVGVVFGGSSGPERDAHMMELMDGGFGETGQLREAAARRPLLALVSRAEASTSRPVTAQPAVPLIPARPATTLPARAREAATRLWAIQVGAFSDRGGALASARAADRAIGVERAEVEVNVATVQRKPVFKAQVTNLTQAEAAAACATLARKKQSCLVVAPSNVAETRRGRG